MAKKKNANDKLSMCMITQAWLSKHWDSSIWDADMIDDAKLHDVTSKIAVLLESCAGVEVEAVYGITHDRDKREVWSESQKAYVFEYKHLHGHWVVKFKNKDSGLSISNIAKAIGLAPEFVEKAKPGRYGYDNMLSYLIHAKDAEKFQYNPKDVVSVVKKQIPSYRDIYAERKAAWEKGRAKKSADKAKSSENVDDLYLKVINGEVTFEQIQLTDEYYAIYAQNISKFDKGFEAYRNRRIAIASDRMNRGELRTKVLYIQGDARKGKSKYAKELANAFIRSAEKRGMRWEYGKGGAVNPTEQYTGQEVFIMNDLRENSMRPEDWLRLLDPENDEAIYGRYKSKVVCPEWIIITCFMDVFDFFNSIRKQSKHHEPMDQFIGRLMARLVIVERDDVRLYPQIEFGDNDVRYVTRNGQVIDYDDNYGSERVKFGFSDKFLPLPNALENNKLDKFAEFMMDVTDNDNRLIKLLNTSGVSVETIEEK